MYMYGLYIKKIKIQARESNKKTLPFFRHIFLIISIVYYLSQNATFTYMKFIFVCYIVFMHCYMYNKTQCIVNHVICKTQKKIKLIWMMFDNTFILEILFYIILRMENVLSFTVFDKFTLLLLLPSKYIQARNTANFSEV